MKDHVRDTGAFFEAKKQGFSDKAIAKLWGMEERDIYMLRKEAHIFPGYRMIDSCAVEFDSYIPYFIPPMKRKMNPWYRTERRSLSWVPVPFGSVRAWNLTTPQSTLTMLTALDTVRVLLDVLEEITLGISTIHA